MAYLALSLGRSSVPVMTKLHTSSVVRGGRLDHMGSLERAPTSAVHRARRIPELSPLSSF